MVGHTRRDCEASKTFAKVTASSVLSSGRPVGPVVAEPLADTASEPMGLKDAPSPRQLGTGGSETSVSSGDQQLVTEEEMGEPAASKRGRDDDDSDFITPNKPARVGLPPESPVSLTNGSIPIMDVADILSESDTVY